MGGEIQLKNSLASSMLPPELINLWFQDIIDSMDLFELIPLTEGCNFICLLEISQNKHGCCPEENILLFAYNIHYKNPPLAPESPYTLLINS